jgi:hypothetical protein
MDARALSTSALRMASTKIPKVFPVAGLICPGGHFFLVTFSLGQQRKSDSAAAADEGRRLLENTKSSRLQAAPTERERVKVAGAPPTQG